MIMITTVFSIHYSTQSQKKKKKEEEAKTYTGVIPPTLKLAPTLDFLIFLRLEKNEKKKKSNQIVPLNTVLIKN